MLLTARILDNVAGVNSYVPAQSVEFTEGDGPSIYLQLVDATKGRASGGFNPPGLRYMPASGSTLSVLFDNLDGAKQVTKTATQPFPLDPSIWKVQLTPTDTVRGTCSLRLTLTEPGPLVTRGSVDRAVRAYPQAKV
jgi:hypothetical protein